MVSLALCRFLLAVTSLLCMIQAAHAFNGDATWYNTGLGNCGAQNSATDHIVAISTRIYNNGQHCGQRINVSYRSQSIIATVEDSCPGCGEQSIDLSPGAFMVLAPLGVGRIHGVTWHWV